MTSAHDQKFRTPLAAAALLSVAFVLPASAQMPASLGTAVEFPAETAAIVQATSRLFDAVEAEAEPRPARPVISAPLTATPASLQLGNTRADVLTSHGPVDHLTGYRISWYPVDRFLGSVDFMGTWDGNRNLVCGFVTWDLSDPDAPVLDSVTRHVPRRLGVVAGRRRRHSRGPAGCQLRPRRDRRELRLLRLNLS